MTERPTIIIPDGMALVPIEPDKNADVIALVESARGICQYAANRSITTQEEVATATEDLSVLSKTVKAVLEKQGDYTKPYKDRLAEINAFFKPVLDALNQADKLTRGKILAYRAEVERKRLEAEAINREKENLARREAALNDGAVTVNTTPVEVPAVAPKTVRTEVGNASVQLVWKFEVTDFKALPDEYKIPDSAKIGKVVRAGLHNIPGCRIWSEESLRVTTK